MPLVFLVSEHQKLGPQLLHVYISPCVPQLDTGFGTTLEWACKELMKCMTKDTFLESGSGPPLLQVSKSRIHTLVVYNCESHYDVCVDEQSIHGTWSIDQLRKLIAARCPDIYAVELAGSYRLLCSVSDRRCVTPDDTTSIQ